MSKPCGSCPLMNLHDYDGTPVAQRKALERRVVELEAQVATLARALRRQQQLNADIDLSAHTKH